ncbi:MULTISPECIES: hypothetical protein [Burkholderia]|uniref:hypothetical protein n=1 Tax=Burkholderia TaxID=32008 RepID=UPI00119A9B9F|nr:MULTISPECIES: hypothetical protein [Burkholderia]TWC56949.1 hypothetical protein FB600_14513 [Burkholderia sp. SJZ089]TWC92182.1 hypothetical protein FBX98_1442 [Burkholderia sp. SJZ115]TWC95333.1 hypothetical protein FB601_1452 [Burkholderia sp. SJZ091]
MTESTSETGVPEDREDLMVFDDIRTAIDVDSIVDRIRQDKVVLIKNLTAVDADKTAYDIASGLGLNDSLELQAGFASAYGHRENVGQYFMSVNRREEYQFIPPHSEGNSSIGLQLASFFCYENSTDGGETILMQVDQSSAAWSSLRERVRRGKLTSTSFKEEEAIRARARYNIDIHADLLRDNDEILRESISDIAGLTLVDVLARPRKTYSRILGQDMYAYWDSIASIDRDSAYEYMQLLEQDGLLKKPGNDLEASGMDNASARRMINSKVMYKELFRQRITHKLMPGEMIVFNNMTWTHAANNWSPGSGVRKITAAFA